MPLGKTARPARRHAALSRSHHGYLTVSGASKDRGRLLLTSSKEASHEYPIAGDARRSSACRDHNGVSSSRRCTPRRNDRARRVVQSQQWHRQGDADSAGTRPHRPDLSPTVAPWGVTADDEALRRPDAWRRFAHDGLRRAAAIGPCDYMRRKTATCHAGPISCATCGARPFSRAIRSIASPGRIAARTSLLCKRSFRFMAGTTSLVMGVSRG